MPRFNSLGEGALAGDRVVTRCSEARSFLPEGSSERRDSERL